MAFRLTLTLTPTFGSREVEVNSKRFSIGRTPENDLALDDTTLSRRHALIEDYDGVFYLSDCGSSNGTLVNGRAVNGAIELQDWDVLTFGGVGDIVVRLRSEIQSGEPHARPSQSNARGVVADSNYAASQNQPDALAPTERLSWLSAPVIAASAAVLILLVAGLALLITETRSGSRSNSKVGIGKRHPPYTEDGDNRQANDSPTPSETVSNINAGDTNTDAGDINPRNGEDTNAAELATIEAAASKVLSGISRDTRPVLTEKPLKEIAAQIQRYKNSPASLRNGLRAMKRDILEVSAMAKSNGLKPPLAIFATLARMDTDGGRGEPAQVAAQICPELGRMRKIFGDELANDSLLTVAALGEGTSLQLRITKLAGRVSDSPTTIRSIWYLHEHQVIGDSTYSFVLRFIAIGVIAQDPQRFGIAADPLTL
jgi:pSer/pThr/pTyr-binding forkhead associated (FHA) protein